MERDSEPLHQGEPLDNQDSGSQSQGGGGGEERGWDRGENWGEGVGERREGGRDTEEAAGDWEPQDGDPNLVQDPGEERGPVEDSERGEGGGQDPAESWGESPLQGPDQPPWDSGSSGTDEELLERSAVSGERGSLDELIVSWTDNPLSRGEEGREGRAEGSHSPSPPPSPSASHCPSPPAPSPPSPSPYHSFSPPSPSPPPSPSISHSPSPPPPSFPSPSPPSHSFFPPSPSPPPSLSASHSPSPPSSFPSHSPSPPPSPSPSTASCQLPVNQSDCYTETGDSVTGDSETEDSMTGDRETGGSVIRDSVTGDRETEDSETGGSVIGDSETGDSVTGDSGLDREEVSDPAPIPGSPGPSGEGGPVQGGAVGEREEGSSVQEQEREAQDCPSSSPEETPLTEAAEIHTADSTGAAEGPLCGPVEGPLVTEDGASGNHGDASQEEGEGEEERAEPGDLTPAMYFEGLDSADIESDSGPPPAQTGLGEAVGEPSGQSPPHANGNKVDSEAACRLAARLFNLEGFKRGDVARHLYKNNEFSSVVAEEYLKFFDFSGQTLDQALRSFLKEFVLVGESQERERVLQHFSQRYQHCNPEQLNTADAALTLTCALMLLNTDLHGQNLGKAMSCSGFISNLDGMNEGGNFPRELLKSLYSSIKNEKLEWAVADSELQDSLLPPGGERGDCGSLRSKSNPFQDLAHDQQAPQFKQGFLTRKAHADIDGKKTPWGRRSWKVFYAVLKGMVLYLQKSESLVQWPRSEEVVSVHHALAERAVGYTKRPNVFRLQTADWRVFLFQAQSSEEMLSWVCRINLVAALFSSPPFPAAVGSQRRFVRPILPASCSSNCQEDQLEAHKHWLESFSQDLAEHQQNQPERGRGRAREQEEYRLREEYLQHETIRYDSYVKLLQARLRLGSDDLARFEALVCEGLEGDAGTLTKSHSSPSLNQDSETPVVRVKRNISERRTYRRIIVPRRSREQL